jgi:hypothetical protein
VLIIAESGQGVVFSIIGYVIFGKPGVCPGLESGNLLRTPALIQLVLQQLMKKMVIAEPSVFRVQGDQKKVVLLKLGNEGGAIDLAFARLSIDATQHIAQICAKTIHD